MWNELFNIQQQVIDTVRRSGPWPDGLWKMHSQRFKYFLSHIDRIEPDGCWIWNRKLSNGYGTFAINVGIQSANGAHVASYLFFKGPLTGIKHHSNIVRHTCHKPACVNPDHLVIGTHFDNSLDKINAGRLNRTPGRRWSRISEETAAKIKLAIYKKEGTAREIAMKYGATRHIVEDIKSGHTWRSVKLPWRRI
jgi:hypothetical protein